MFRGTSMGGFSIRCTTLDTESAWDRGIGDMAGAHCLEKRLAFLATDLADNDIFRPLTHGCAQEF